MAFTIKELESLSGIKAHTIRIWEQRYNFLKPDRTATNIRTYSNEELKTLLTVALLNKYGYKISRIDEMQSEQRSAAVLNIGHDEAQTEYLINDLIGCMVDLRATEFEERLNRVIVKTGIIETIHTIIFPFLEKIGLLWQTNKLFPAQEHIVSNIVRQKLVSAIDCLPHSDAKEPLFLLFLPENEHHELGLLFVYFLLKRKRIPVLYLGANVPLKDVQYIVHLKKPAALYIHLTSMTKPLQLQKFFTTLSDKAINSNIYISGRAVQVLQNKLSPNLKLLQSMQEVSSYISSL
jgi:DNA-binding transcriptional MerR regulator